MEELKSLLAQGHGVNSSDEIGWTALHEAALNNIDTRACRLLLDHGANVGAANSYGETPLHFAAANENGVVVDMCRMLIDRGANVAAADQDLKVPLTIAEERGGQRSQAQQADLRELLQLTSPPRGRSPAAVASGGAQEGLSFEATAAMLALLAMIAALNGWMAGHTLTLMVLGALLLGGMKHMASAAMLALLAMIAALNEWVYGHTLILVVLGAQLGVGMAYMAHAYVKPPAPSDEAAQPQVEAVSHQREQLRLLQVVRSRMWESIGSASAPAA